MDEFVVDLRDDDGIELRRIDIGTADDVIAFEVEGVIRGIDEDVLEAISEKDLVPTEIRFEASPD